MDWTQVEEMTNRLYNMCCDIDYTDYTETETSDKNDIENALIYLYTMKENKRNFDYFRTFWNVLETITETA